MSDLLRFLLESSGTIVGAFVGFWLYDLFKDRWRQRALPYKWACPVAGCKISFESSHERMVLTLGGDHMLRQHTPTKE